MREYWRLFPNGNAVTGFSLGYAGVKGQSSVYPIVGANDLGSTVFSVDSSGNIVYTGTISSASRAADGTTVAAYSTKTTSPTVEDTGPRSLVGGSATVLLDPVFARTIDSASAYRVFLTANGDTHGLFVARKTAVGFAVHENEGGRSTVSFDYRIVATALGHAGQRMAVTMPGAVTPLSSAQRPPTSLSKSAPLPRIP